MIELPAIENMGHITNTFWPDSEPHHLQHGERTRVVLLFAVKANPVKLVSVKIPSGCPLYRVRPLIAFCESELAEIYGSCHRVNVVLTRKEFADDWKYEKTLPAYGVQYI